MERIPEPELMEEKKQVISYDEADFSEGEVNLINQINHYLFRKNIPSLIEAYGRSEKLKRKTNLILILGCRESTSKLDPQKKDVFNNIFETIDIYNLYGKVAYPKKHLPSQIPALYRWAASRGGVFVNPA